MTEEFDAFAVKSGQAATLTTFVVDGALDALKAGDAQRHNALVAEQAAACGAYDAIMLAHFSTSRAKAAAEAAIDRPILTAPDAAVARMRYLLKG